jgi:hypothetical protein
MDHRIDWLAYEVYGLTEDEITVAEQRTAVPAAVR